MKQYTISEESDNIIVTGVFQLTYNKYISFFPSSTSVEIEFKIVITQKVVNGVRCLQITFNVENITSPELVDKMKILAFETLFPSKEQELKDGITKQFPLSNHILDFLFFDISSIIQKK
jgi:hypothetical protein